MDANHHIAVFREKLKDPYFAYTTAHSYYFIAKHFLEYFKDKNTPIDITMPEIEDYLLLWPNVNTRAAKLCGIKAYFNLCENKFHDFSKFDKPKRLKPILKGIDKAFLLDKIDDIDNRKHKAFVALAYSTGMKLDEIINLKLNNISFQKKLIYVEDSNNLVLIRTIELTNKLSDILKRYIKKYNPTLYLFNGRINIKYSKKSALCVVKKHIGEEFNFHHIRHATAYSLIDSGVDIKHVQKLLGHNSKKTTKLYELEGKSKLKLPL